MTSFGAALAQVEKELAAIWAAPPSPGEAPKTRVCTMNLVVVTGSEDIAERYARVTDEVTLSTPARTILVTVEPDAREDDLAGEASAVCALGDRQVICSERIRLRAKGAASARVSSAIEALRVPEIPTVLIWLGRVHTNDPIFVDLSKSADRVILDTEYTSLASLLSLGKWARSGKDRPKVADIAWTRLSTWQELCARFFDDPRHRAHALAIDELEITQASPRGQRIGSEAALLLGWLATRLGWKLDRLGGALRFRRADGARVQVGLLGAPNPLGVAPGALAGVSLVARAHDITLRGSIRRQLGSGNPREPAADMGSLRPMSQTLDADVLQWRCEEEGQMPIEQSIRLGANRGARLLDRTLHRPAQDTALDAAVEFAEELFEDGLTVS